VLSGTDDHGRSGVEARGGWHRSDGRRGLVAAYNRRIDGSPFALRVAIGSDHAGFALKQHLIGVLKELGHDVDDHGTHSEEPVDYPIICAGVARSVVRGEADRGIVIGGSGQGEQLAANKVRGARAALCNDLFTARLSRAHNNANVLSMGGRIVAPGLADEILRVWLETPFDGGRHERRLEQLAAIEEEERTT
jgi:ribose 5-phosphate isomerase B